ncbi:hypothetical protein [Kingella potus]|uniref:hypothetical protein n=1 Tax=Kingella potus TaxID=265175 RepID=UPI001FD5B4FA|nr:hypothetical protein [Kingella potus]UOP00652.1 hypothetical protein LVJ84_12720 [Kingella potus]
MPAKPVFRRPAVSSYDLQTYRRVCGAATHAFFASLFPGFSEWLENTKRPSENLQTGFQTAFRLLPRLFSAKQTPRPAPQPCFAAALRAAPHFRFFQRHRRLNPP